MNPSDDPNPKIRHEDLDEVLEHALQLQRQQEATKQAYVDETTLDAIAESLDLPETVLAKAQADLVQLRKRRRMRVLLLTGIAGIGATIATGYFLATRLKPSVPQVAATASPVSQATADGPSNPLPTPVAAATPIDPSATQTPPKVVFGRSLLAANLTLGVREISRTRFGDSLNLLGVVVNRGPQAVEALSVQTELLGHDGRPVSVETFEAVANYELPLAPGDTCVFGKRYLSADSKIDQVRLSVVGRKDRPASVVPEGRVPLSWAVVQPAGISLEAGERQRKLNNFGRLAFADVGISLRHVGTAPMHSLRVEMRFFDQANQLLKAKDRQLLYGTNTPVLPGDRLRCRWLETLPKTFHHYDVRIVACT